MPQELIGILRDDSTVGRWRVIMMNVSYESYSDEEYF